MYQKSQLLEKRTRRSRGFNKFSYCMNIRTWCFCAIFTKIFFKLRPKSSWSQQKICSYFFRLYFLKQSGKYIWSLWKQLRTKIHRMITTNIFVKILLPFWWYSNVRRHGEPMSCRDWRALSDDNDSHDLRTHALAATVLIWHYGYNVMSLATIPLRLFQMSRC